MNRFLAVLVSVALLLGISGLSLGAKIKGGDKGYDGTVRRLDRATMILQIGTADTPKEVTIVFAANTKYTAEGKSITHADLAEGQHVTVSVIDNVAKHVDVKRTEKAEKSEKAADPKKKK